MKYKVYIFLALLTISCDTNKTLKVSSPSQNPEVISLLDSLNQELTTFKNGTLIPGLAVSIVNKESVVFQKGYGFANLKSQKAFTPQTVQPIASISKTFIGVALMKLVDLGKINLDDEINSILPFKIVHPKFPNTPITIRHLATHTSSISDNYGENGDGYWLLESNNYKRGEIRDDMFEFLEIIGQNQALSIEQHIKNTCLPDGKWYKENTYLDHAPGTTYSYSNNATTLAGLIIEHVSKTSLDNFCKKYIFRPLKMKNTSWRYSKKNADLLATQYFPDSQSAPTEIFKMPRFTYSRIPAGHLITSIEDLSLYLMEMIRGHEGKGKILSNESFKTLLNPQLDNSHYGDRYSGEFNVKYDVGIFWGMSYEGLKLHNGGEIGVYSFIYFDPETSYGAVGMINARINSFGDSRSIIRKFEKKLSRIK